VQSRFAALGPWVEDAIQELLSGTSTWSVHPVLVSVRGTTGTATEWPLADYTGAQCGPRKSTGVRFGPSLTPLTLPARWATALTCGSLVLVGGRMETTILELLPTTAWAWIVSTDLMTPAREMARQRGGILMKQPTEQIVESRVLCLECFW